MIETNELRLGGDQMNQLIGAIISQAGKLSDAELCFTYY